MAGREPGASALSKPTSGQRGRGDWERLSGRLCRSLAWPGAQHPAMPLRGQWAGREQVPWTPRPSSPTAAARTGGRGCGASPGGSCRPSVQKEPCPGQHQRACTAAPPSRRWGHRGAGSCCRPSPVPSSLLPRAGPAGAPRGLPGPQASSQLTPAPPAGPGEQGPEVGGVLSTPLPLLSWGHCPAPLTVRPSRWEPHPLLLPLNHQHPGQGLPRGPEAGLASVPHGAPGDPPVCPEARPGLCVQGQRRTEVRGAGWVSAGCAWRWWAFRGAGSTWRGGTGQG